MEGANNKTNMDLQMIKVKEKAKAMDAETFTKLYLENYTYLYKYALSLTKNVHDAEDVLQDTCEKVYFSKKHSINKDNFKRYMRAAVLNEFRKLHNKRKIYKENVDVYIDAEKVPTFMAKPEEYEKMISYLSEKEQMMYDLRYKENYSEKDIADMLGMNPSTVRSIFHRSNQKLKDIFKKLGIAMFILCAFISVTVAAVSFISYIQDMFRTYKDWKTNDGILEAIEKSNWFQKCDMDYVDLGDGYKVKLDYFVLDEMSLYLVFDLESEKDLSRYNEFALLDLKIENENGELICDKADDSLEQYQKLYGEKTIYKTKSHLKQLIYMYTDSFPISNNLMISFSKLGLHKNLLFDKEIDTINSNFNILVNLSEKFINRTYTSYISDKENLTKAIVSDTGFYAIIGLSSTKEANVKFLDVNGIEYNCFSSATTNYDSDKLFEHIIVSNYNNKNSKNLKLIIDDIEYELKNQP